MLREGSRVPHILLHHCSVLISIYFPAFSACRRTFWVYCWVELEEELKHVFHCSWRGVGFCYSSVSLSITHPLRFIPILAGFVGFSSSSAEN